MIGPDQSTVTVLENVAILYLRFVSTIFVLITIRSNREPRTPNCEALAHDHRFFVPFILSCKTSPSAPSTKNATRSHRVSGTGSSG